MKTKAEWRVYARQILPVPIPAEWNYKIIQNLSSLLSHFPQKTQLGIYAAIPGEPPLMEFANQLFETKFYQLSLPKIQGSMMEYRFFEKWSDLNLNLLGILESDGAPAVPQIVLVPGLLFDPKTGVRLGRGKGYFDRYLTTFKGLKVGVAYNAQLMDSLIFETHDQSMDFLVTENGIIGIQKK